MRNVAICQTPPGRKKTRFPGLTKPEIFLSAMFDFFSRDNESAAVAVKGSELGLSRILALIPVFCPLMARLGLILCTNFFS